MADSSVQWLLSIWRTAEGAGGALSLFIVVLLALAGGALGLVHALAAGVVLERFAACARGWRWTLFFALLACAVCGSALARWADPSLVLASWGEWAPAFVRATLALMPICALSLTLVHWVSRTRRRAALSGVGSVLLLAAAGAASFGSGELQRLGLHALRATVAVVALGLVPRAAAGLAAMRKGVEWRIATRYLVAERRQVFVSAITLICVMGVASGVWLIVTVLSVMNGFERSWREQIADSHAHFVVRSRRGRFAFDEALRRSVTEVEGVLAVSPVIEGEGMVRSAQGELAPVRLRGIDPASTPRVSGAARQMREGSLAALSQPGASAGARPGLVLGDALADRLGAKLGDEVVLISPFGGPPTPLGPSPRLVRFRVVGRFESPFMQYDEVYAWTDLSSARRFLDVGDIVDGLEVRSADFYRSLRVARRVGRRLGYPFYTRDWKELFPSLFRALESNRSLLFLLLGMIMIVAAFVIVVTLLMMIMAKSTDIAILETMGATDAAIERIFAIEGTLIGLSGVTLGVLAGIAVTGRLAWIQTQIERLTGIDTLPEHIYQISTLPSRVDPLQAIGVAALAFTLALGATSMPSRHAAHIDPVEALRHD